MILTSRRFLIEVFWLIISIVGITMAIRGRRMASDAARTER